MVNYYLQLFLPHTERQLVGIDKQFEHLIFAEVDLALARGAGSNPVVLLHPPAPTQSSRHNRGTRANPEPCFDER